MKYPNITYVLSAKRDTPIESDLIAYQLAGEPYNRNLCCASDTPYGRQSWNFGGFRQMFQSLRDPENHTDARIREYPGLFYDVAVQNYLGTNFAEIAIRGYESILSKW